MRLAIIASHPIQYYAPWFRLLARESGLQVRVFYLWDFGVNPRHDPGFQKKILWDIPLLDGYDHEFVPNTSRAPGTHHPGGLRNPDLIPRLQAWKPDAVLLMGFSWHSMRKVLLHRDFRQRIIIRGDSHDLARSPGLKSCLARLAARLLFRRARAFLYCGTLNHAYFKNRGVPDKRLFLCPHAIDQTRFQPNHADQEAAHSWRHSLGIPPDHRVILFAGKFEAKKDPLRLLEAFLQLNPEKTTLLFVGSGALEPALRAKASQHPCVKFHPPENQSAMPRIYQMADLFVLPSCGPGETWGLAVQESLACGVPVITSGHVGCTPDLVRSDVNGLIFSAGSTNGLVSALSHALSPGTLDRWKHACLPSLSKHNYHAAMDGLLKACRTLR